MAWPHLEAACKKATALGVNAAFQMLCVLQIGLFPECGQSECLLRLRIEEKPSIIAQYSTTMWRL